MSILDDLFTVDQKLRSDFSAGLIDFETFRQADDENIAAFERYFASNPYFPTKQESKDAYKAVIILTLHSQNERLFEKAIQFLQKASPVEVDKSDLAFLVDRSHIRHGEPQVYGTQYKKMPDNAIQFFPIEDAEQVDIRRKEIGLEPLENYRKNALGI